LSRHTFTLLTEEERVIERWQQRVGADGDCWRNDSNPFTAAAQSNYWHNFTQVLPQGDQFKSVSLDFVWPSFFLECFDTFYNVSWTI